MQINDDQKKLALKAVRVTVVLVPVIGGAVSAYLTGNPFDWAQAVKVVLPLLLGP